MRQSDAILARNLFGATPAEAVRCVTSRICARIASAVAVALAASGFGWPVALAVLAVGLLAIAQLLERWAKGGER